MAAISIISDAEIPEAKTDQPNTLSITHLTPESESDSQVLLDPLPLLQQTFLIRCIVKFRISLDLERSLLVTTPSSVQGVLGKLIGALMED